MQHYVVLINPALEQAKRVAECLADVVFRYRCDHSLAEEIHAFLLANSKPADAVTEIMPLGDFMRNLNHSAPLSFVAHVAWATTELEDDNGGSLEDICYLLKGSGWNMNNIDMLIYDLTTADTAWLYARHESEIIQWLTDSGQDIFNFGYGLQDVFTKHEKFLFEIVCRWAVFRVKRSL
ncbi:hypothetical protein PL75_01065 [Neisseria arctica]|uniref:Uncharacterized protein n=1 Tax=Neisseria arctica TaxID=1470200 RepID=A0A0J0YTZ9_9NEIS|nr:hypothetical protein [Neisseria arctica]KLT73576.1 hypothetical protein PL75_01065 [Neisseria arctica]UOO85691.1 hypothetical protein LVJ86_05475 [Neisseria arctica]